MTGVRTLAVSALGHRGEGIARDGDETIFVPLTLAGETITASVAGNRGKLIDILAPSPARIEPFCPHFGPCGGCQLQHMAPDAYAGFKRGRVAEALERAGVDANVAPLVIAHGAGRRRVTLHARRNGAGFMGLRSHDVHAIAHCPILVAALDNAPAIARDLAALLGPCEILLTATDTGLDAAIRGKGLKSAPDLARVARRHDLARLAVNGEVAYQLRQPLLAMGRARVPLPVGGFLQATAAAETELAAHVLASAKGFKAVADLFCGIGPFALRLAAHAPVFAADSDGPAIAALTAAARATQGLKPLAAERRDLFREPLTPFELGRFDCIVLDPPRAGASAQIGQLARAEVRRVIYVSCDPHSFARDAASLIAGGYRIGPVTPVDQFAFSAHVELVAVFDRL